MKTESHLEEYPLPDFLRPLFWEYDLTGFLVKILAIHSCSVPFAELATAC
jgi:hypothetical protein